MSLPPAACQTQRPARTRGRSRVPAGRGEAGTVTAETMVVLPLLAAVALGLVWLLALAAAQMRVVDAAREVARAAARDDSTASAIALGRRVAPQGAQIRVHEGGGTVSADVVAVVHGPGGLFDFLPEIDVTASAVAAEEGQ